MESFLHTGKSILQPETLALGEQGLGAEVRASEVRPRRGLGWAVWGQPEGVRLWSPQCGKEPGLLLGGTRKGGDCHRSFFLRRLSGSRAWVSIRPCTELGWGVGL